MKRFVLSFVFFVVIASLLSDAAELQDAQTAEDFKHRGSCLLFPCPSRTFCDGYTGFCVRNQVCHRQCPKFQHCALSTRHCFKSICNAKQICDTGDLSKCAAVLCLEGTTCVEINGEARCVAIKP